MELRVGGVYQKVNGKNLGFYQLITIMLIILDVWEQKKNVELPLIFIVFREYYIKRIKYYDTKLYKVINDG